MICFPYMNYIPLLVHARHRIKVSSEGQGHFKFIFFFTLYVYTLSNKLESSTLLQLHGEFPFFIYIHVPVRSFACVHACVISKSSPVSLCAGMGTRSGVCVCEHCRTYNHSLIDLHAPYPQSRCMHVFTL